MPGAPLSIELQMFVATEAIGFFSPFRDPHFGEVLGRPNKPDGPDGKPVAQDWLTSGDFLEYLRKERPDYPWNNLVFRVLQLLEGLARLGYLMLIAEKPGETTINGRIYIPLGLPWSQSRSALWLSPLIGPQFVIESYGAVTIPVRGTKDNGDDSVGSGLIIDESHILTAKHVVDQMTLNKTLRRPHMAAPGELDTMPSDWEQKVVNVHCHPHLDVAVIEVEPSTPLLGFVPDQTRPGKMALRPVEPTPGFTALPGIAFRNPMWADETIVLGYPPSQLPDGRDGPNLIVQRGQVVNPSVTGFGGERLFLFSAIARPGSSGGPIVAQDGRVIGMVTDEGYSAAGTSGEELPDADPRDSFYVGIPGSEIVMALQDLELGHLVTWETFTNPRPRR